MMTTASDAVLDDCDKTAADHLYGHGSQIAVMRHTIHMTTDRGTD